MVNFGTNVNEQNKSDETPLHLAASAGYPEIVNILIAKNAEVNVNYSCLDTSLNNAICNTGRGVMKVRIEGGYPAFFPSIDGKLAVVQALLAKEACVNEKNKDEIMPLHEAARSGSLEVVELLVVHGVGADISAKDNLARTPLHYAKEF